MTLKIKQEAHNADAKLTGGDDYVKFEFNMTRSTFNSYTFPLQFEESGPLSGKPLDIKIST
jgi:hypothetical protein